MKKYMVNIDFCEIEAEDPIEAANKYLTQHGYKVEAGDVPSLTMRNSQNTVYFLIATGAMTNQLLPTPNVCNNLKLCVVEKMTKPDLPPCLAPYETIMGEQPGISLRDESLEEATPIIKAAFEAGYVYSNIDDGFIMTRHPVEEEPQSKERGWTPVSESVRHATPESMLQAAFIGWWDFE